MDPWNVGLVALILVGLAVIVYGALSDRAKNKRAAAAMLAPPDRQIPRFAPDSPAPHYLSELQARRTPTEAVPTNLTEDQRVHVSEELKSSNTVRIDVGYLSTDFVTDAPSGWAVITQPRILVCSEVVETVRELLGILEKLAVSEAPAVIAAPAFGREVESTLAVNVIQRTVRIVAVAADGTRLKKIAAASGASIVSRADLQAGYTVPEDLGRCERWVSTPTTSYLIKSPAEERGGN